MADDPFIINYANYVSRNARLFPQPLINPYTGETSMLSSQSAGYGRFRRNLALEPRRIELEPRRETLEQEAARLGGHIVYGARAGGIVVTPEGETIGRERLRQAREAQAAEGTSGD